jgi:hypothetical protein
MVNNQYYITETDVSKMLNLSGLPFQFQTLFTRDYVSIKRSIIDNSDVIVALTNRVDQLEIDVGAIEVEIVNLDSGKQDNIQFQDNGSDEGSPGGVTTVNFIGASLSYLGGTLTVSVPSANSVNVSVDFGANFTDKAQSVVTGQAWVTASSKITTQVLSTNVDESYLIDMKVVISDIVAGVGFTVTVWSQPQARGIYTVMCLGV